MHSPLPCLPVYTVQDCSGTVVELYLGYSQSDLVLVQILAMTVHTKAMPHSERYTVVPFQTVPNRMRRTCLHSFGSATGTISPVAVLSVCGQQQPKKGLLQRLERRKGNLYESHISEWIL